MKKFFIISIFFVFLYACSGNSEKVIEAIYPDGSPKTEKYYKVDGGDSEMVKEVNYYSNKQIMMEGEYKENKRDGDWVYYYENGNKWSEGTFKEGLDEGKRTTYFENGQKRYEGNYSKGEETGVWKFWDENGKLQKTVDYDTIKTKK